MLNNKKGQSEITAIVLVILLILGFIALLMFVIPQYNVWSKTLSGKAHLKEAEFSRQIAVVEAEAKKMGATQLAEAEIIRAEGIAKANEIIGNSITEEYLKYRFIEGLNDGTTEVIYVPTEANLPILEARDN